jgi:hypothetical protein
MEFKVPYLTAMREQAPRMFNQLQKSGRLEAHLNQKAAEAKRMFDDLTRSAPKPLSDQMHSETSRLVMETLIEFQPET